MGAERGAVVTMCCFGAPWRCVRPQDRSFQTQPLNLRLPDCRLSIVSSRLLPVSELESALQMEPDAFKALYSAEKPKLEENLIFFCQMGKRGLQATQLAQSLGYKGYGLGKRAGPVVPGDCLLASVLPSPLFFFHRARNYAGVYREWLQKEG